MILLLLNFGDGVLRAHVNKLNIKNNFLNETSRDNISVIKYHLLKY